MVSTSSFCCSANACSCSHIATPSLPAKLSTPAMSCAVCVLSSLAGIGYMTIRGSAFESMTPMVGTWSIAHSRMAWRLGMGLIESGRRLLAPALWSSQPRAPERCYDHINDICPERGNSSCIRGRATLAECPTEKKRVCRSAIYSYHHGPPRFGKESWRR